MCPWLGCSPSPMVALVVLLVVGSITGNVKMKSSCCISDLRCDPRMWDGFLHQTLPATGWSVTPPESASGGWTHPVGGMRVRLWCTIRRWIETCTGCGLERDECAAHR